MKRGYYSEHMEELIKNNIFITVYGNLVPAVVRIKKNDMIVAIDNRKGNLISSTGKIGNINYRTGKLKLNIWNEQDKFIINYFYYSV